MPGRSRFVSSALACSFLALLGAAPAPAPLSASAQRPPGMDWSLGPSRIAANCSTRIAAAKAAIAKIVAVPVSERSFTTVVLPLENASADLNDDLVVETLSSNTSTLRPVRDASFACQNDVSDFFTATTARPDLYAAVADAGRSGTASDAAQRKLTEIWLVALKRSGAALSTADRTTFVTLGQRLSKLQNDYAANLGNDKTTVPLTQAQAAGVPADVVAGFTKTASGYLVTVDESDYSAIVANATDPATRKAMYFAYNNRSMPKNRALLEEAIGLRAQLAHLLGYPSWAAFVLDDRMAKSVTRVDTFLGDLDTKLLPAARGDVARLAALKAADLHVASATIEPWDFGYYDNLLRKSAYSVDANAVRQYFPVQHVERAVFDIYAKLLGVTFAPRANPNLWAPDVTEWTVTDTASGRYIGDFYLDLFPRDGKYSHFASFPLLPNRALGGGAVRPPLDAIIGNWPKPAPGAPALLSHDDVETFFHEFGHDMATLLATTPYESLSSGFRQDFVEAPSQMLENWVWDPAILRQLSSNVLTGKPLPDALIAKMRTARYVDDAYVQTRQIMLATVDMRYHTLAPPVDTNAIWREVAQSETPIGLPADAHPEASFGHLMGGYDAGYYGYLWSKVYAQDMFTAFERGGLESPIVGARYRTDILAPAREREPDDEVNAFLGRPMNPAAFYAEFDAAARPAGSPPAKRRPFARGL